MTRLTLAHGWNDPFSPEEIAKTPTEAENKLGAKELRNRAFANLPGLLHAAEKLNKERN